MLFKRKNLAQKIKVMVVRDTRRTIKRAGRTVNRVFVPECMQLQRPIVMKMKRAIRPLKSKRFKKHWS